MVPGLRESMESMRPASGAKLHWKQIRTGAARAAVLADVAALPVEHLVVVRLGGVRAPSERRRRVCLRRMLFELVELGVAHVVAESRGSADDRRDRNLLDALRAQKQIPSALRLDHMPGPLEPMLWIPDVVAGAITASRTTGAALTSLEHRLSVVEILDT